MSTAIGFLIVLGSCIIVHEFGHLLVAKLCGIRVLRFSVGFGRVLVKKVFRGTEYVISAVPIGGYVRLFGESEEASKDADARTAGFYYASVWKRIGIVFAGPAFNFLFAYILLVSVFLSQGLIEQEISQTIKSVHAGSPAEAAGLKPEDKVVVFRDVAVDPQNLESVISTATEKNSAEPFRVVVQRLENATTVTHEMVLTPTLYGSTYRAGLEFATIERTVPCSLSEALSRPVVVISSYVKITLKVVGGLLTGKESPKVLGGPILIYQQTHTFLEKSLSAFVFFISLISLGLGVMNLMPIPVLDGGHLMFYAYEVVFRRRVPQTIQNVAGNIGVVAVVSLMLLTLYVDITR